MGDEREERGGGGGVRYLEGWMGGMGGEIMEVGSRSRVEGVRFGAPSLRREGKVLFFSVKLFRSLRIF